LNRSNRYAVLFLILVLAAGAVRFTSPGLRPMHADEAVNAHKLGVLLESGEYRYDRNEYHGPVLYYSTLVAARLKGEKSFASLNEPTLRGVTALYGLLIPVLLLFLVRELKWTYVLVSTALVAFAPGLLFYSRYYIHEILLVFFSVGFIVSGYRFLADRKNIWLVLTGVFMGLMHATKETCVINYAACALALAATIIIRRGWRAGPAQGHPPFRIMHLFVILVIAAVVSAVFFSSFFTSPKGIIDSFTAYALYFRRAGMDDAHLHPWYFYLSLWMPIRGMKGCTGGEIWLLVTGAAGLGFVLTGRKKEPNRDLLLFIGLYTVILLVIYSAISYKTPWNMLQFYTGMLFLSGYGIIRIIRTAPWRWLRIILAVLLVSGGIQWMWTGIQLNFRYYSEPENPYVYARTGNDIPEIAARIDSIGSVYPGGHDLPVEVIFPGNDYWPLPWYLRRFPNTGFYSEVSFDTPAAPVIIIHKDLETDLVRKLYELPPPGKRYLYLNLYETSRELRPGVPVCVLVRKDLWDLYQESRQPH
jgi:uncharacterized protein (TIGR03663 family)